MLGATPFVALPLLKAPPVAARNRLNQRRFSGTDGGGTGWPSR